MLEASSIDFFFARGKGVPPAEGTGMDTREAYHPIANIIEDNRGKPKTRRTE